MKSFEKILVSFPIPSGWDFVKDPCGNEYFIRTLERSTRDVYQVISAEMIRIFRGMQKKDPNYKLRMIEYSDGTGKFRDQYDFLKWLSEKFCMFPDSRLCTEDYIGDIDAMRELYMNYDNEVDDK